jgi:hypothetical protein
MWHVVATIFQVSGGRGITQRTALKREYLRWHRSENTRGKENV